MCTLVIYILHPHPLMDSSYSIEFKSQDWLNTWLKASEKSGWFMINKNLTIPVHNIAALKRVI